jgi:hypothetical protein
LLSFGFSTQPSRRIFQNLFEGRPAFTSGMLVQNKKTRSAKHLVKLLAIRLALRYDAFEPVDERGDTKAKGGENSRSRYYVNDKKTGILEHVPHMSTFTFSRRPGGAIGFLAYGPRLSAIAE